MAAPTDLVDLGHGRGQLRATAASSLFRMDARLGRPVDVNSAYRDWDDQWVKYTAYLRWLAKTGPWAPLALHPQYSWHCQGLAIDTDDRLSFFNEHGWFFDVKVEPWHGQYYPERDKHFGNSSGSQEDIVLDDADKKWLNEMGQSIIDQVNAAVPPNVWAFPIQAQDAAGNPAGKEFPAAGYLTSTNALAHAQATGDVSGLVGEIIAAGVAEKVADEIGRRLSAGG